MYRMDIINATLSASSSTHTGETPSMSAEGIALILAGVSATIVSIVYSFKNVRHCEGLMCIECDQKTSPTPTPIIANLPPYPKYKDLSNV